MHEIFLKEKKKEMERKKEKNKKYFVWYDVKRSGINEIKLLFLMDF